ncbi:MAG: 50S ribosomal protein L15 [Patescibacteria group bacterium]
MSLKLHNLKPSAGSRRKPKRLGRGDSAGQGSYSGKGQKGQKARSGGKNKLARKGLRNLLMSSPKLRGFKSFHPKAVVLNLEVLEKHFNDGDKVSIASLKEKGLVSVRAENVKILGDGELTKKLNIESLPVSGSAKAKIEARGGSVK